MSSQGMSSQGKNNNFFVGRVLPILVCVLLAFFTWIFVMSVSDPQTTYELDRVSVRYAEDAVDGYTLILRDSVSVVVTGNRSDVVRCLQEGIVLELVEDFEASELAPGVSLSAAPKRFRILLKDGSPLPASVEAVFTSVKFDVVQA